MNLYIMRHGTTLWNERGVSQGRSNNKLSPAGKQLAQSQAKKYKDVEFDIIIVSPLMRTLQTANIMNQYHNVKKVLDSRIIEIDQGIFTGQTISKLPPDLIEQRILRSPECGMESVDEIFERTKDFYEDIKNNCKYKNVLVVTHNWIASLLEILILGQTENYKNTKQWTRFDNAQIKKFAI